MQIMQIGAVMCLVVAVICAALGWATYNKDDVGVEQMWLGSVQMFLAGILVCLIEMAWGG